MKSQYRIDKWYLLVSFPPFLLSRTDWIMAELLKQQKNLFAMPMAGLKLLSVCEAEFEGSLCFFPHYCIFLRANTVCVCQCLWRDSSFTALLYIRMVMGERDTSARHHSSVHFPWHLTQYLRIQSLSLDSGILVSWETETGQYGPVSRPSGIPIWISFGTRVGSVHLQMWEDMLSPQILN